MCCESEDVEREARITVVTQPCTRRGRLSSTDIHERVELKMRGEGDDGLIRKRIAKSGLSKVDILCCRHAESC